jgi:hypothetical protein
MAPDRLEQRAESLVGRQRHHRLDVGHPRGPELQQRIVPTGMAELDPGHGEVQRRLLLG